MAADLSIRDGDPKWWNSPDIWIVPGGAPDGPPGPPVAGRPCFVWGHVRNDGDMSVSGGEVRFHWSNPATGVLRSNSTTIGSAFVDLAPGEGKDVLCLTPWVPVIVNDGHECVVAEVLHESDPLPQPLTDAFDPPHHDQIAQRNLSVLQMTSSMLTMAIQVGAPPRRPKQVRVRIEMGGKLDRASLARLGLDRYRAAAEPGPDAGLGLDPSCDDPGTTEVGLDLDGGTARAVYLRVRGTPVPRREYQLIHVIESDGDDENGGITFALISGTE